MLNVLPKAAISALLLITTAYAAAESLPDARAGFETQIIQVVEDDGYRFPEPPKELFSLIKFDSAVGPLSAYVSKPSNPAEKSPAIIWLAGGFPVGGMDESAWLPEPKGNDQSAKAYREAGVVMMYPSLRGMMGNPGQQEGFYGEVDDVLSALEYLKSQAFVDPEQIYLGGHSTGGTLALLVAESTDEFKAVFAFGPVAAPINYGSGRALHDPNNEQENRLRAPYYYLDSIQSPTFVIEGDQGNYDQLYALYERNANPNIHFMPIEGATHFSVLQPINAYLAKRIVSSDGQPIQIYGAALQSAYNYSVGQ